MKFPTAILLISLCAQSLVFGVSKATEDSALDPTGELSAAEAGSENAVPEEFRKAYFGERPDVFLIDPQKLLSPVDYRERLDFLNYHAGDSQIDLYVYVFSAEQNLPSEVNMAGVTTQYFSSGRPAAIVHYFQGNPQRASFHLSPALLAVVSPGEQHRALESSVMQALSKEHAADQIDAFIVQMSIRTYWMETMLNGTSEDGALASPAKKAEPQEAKADLLEWLRPHLETASQYWVPAASVVAVLLLALGFRLWSQLRWRYRFPELEVEPRLGGAHAAGVGAVISFSSSAAPPASQREQMPDFLRRT